MILLILCLLLLGLACACGSNHHSQAVDRAITAVDGLPALIEVWSLIVAAMLAVGVIYSARRTTFGRASPAQLQRFLF